MEAQSHLLSWVIFVPTIGAVLVLLSPSRSARTIAVVASLVTFGLSLLLFRSFAWWDLSLSQIFGAGYGAALHHVTQVDWITAGGFKIQYYIGLDGLNFPLVILTTLITALACLASWNMDRWQISKGPRGYFALFLLLETGMLGVFCALDFFLFYIFWEVMLLPMYFLIGVWGGPRREYAAIKFFLFTLAGSVLMLVALIAMYFYSGTAVHHAMAAEGVSSIPSAYRPDVVLTGGTFDIIELSTNETIQAHFGAANTMLLGMKFAPLMFMLLFIGFAIKLPCVPVHTWLPDAHVEAPTPISMILAGILLKMGGYGFLRLCYPVFPSAGEHWALFLAVIGVVSILYGALCAMAQTDFKKLVAYSSVSHMGYVLLGISVMTATGFQGAMFQMIAHGISSPMCFFLVGVIYERAHHREINNFGGLWLTMPKYGSMATLGFFASLGLPGLCGFIGEVYVLLGTFEAGSKFWWAYTMAVLAAFGVVLTAGYILWLIQRVYLGKVREEYKGFPEATGREMLVMAPLGTLCVVLGVLPKQSLFNFMNGTLNLMLEHIGSAGSSVMAAAQAFAG